MEEIIKSIDVTKESIAKLGARTDEIGGTLPSDSAAESSMCRWTKGPYSKKLEERPLLKPL